MTTKVVLLDSVVPILAFGGDHPLRTPCRELIRNPARHGLVLTASTELIQEFTFHRLRRLPAVQAAQDSRDLLATVGAFSFDLTVLDVMLQLIEHHAIRGRDAVHAATALVHGISTIVSTDSAFDAVPGLERIDPTQL